MSHVIAVDYHIFSLGTKPYMLLNCCTFYVFIASSSYVVSDFGKSKIMQELPDYILIIIFKVMTVFST